jgi:hypothetical protein
MLELCAVEACTATEGDVTHTVKNKVTTHCSTISFIRTLERADSIQTKTEFHSSNGEASKSKVVLFFGDAHPPNRY